MPQDQEFARNDQRVRPEPQTGTRHDWPQWAIGFITVARTIRRLLSFKCKPGRSDQSQLIFMPDYALNDEQAAAETFAWLMDTTLSQDAFFSPDTTIQAQLLYHALLYEGTVNNGGHAQFIVNRDSRIVVFDATLRGLTMIGAIPYADIVEALIATAQDHPDQVAQLADPMRPYAANLPQLDQLDDRFFAASNVRTIRNFAYQWLRQSPSLSIVSRQEFYDHIALSEMSP